MTIVPDKQSKIVERKIVIIFLSISLDMCFGCSDMAEAEGSLVQDSPESLD